MEKLLEQGKLRSDLFHRLNVLALNVPPLRERVEDIQPFNGRFYKKLARSLRFPCRNMMLIFELFERAALARQCESFTMCCIVACSLAKNNQLDIESLNLKPVQSAVISADDFGEQTLDEIMGQYEASVLRSLCSVSKYSKIGTTIRRITHGDRQ